MKLFVACVLVVIVNINKYEGCYTNEDISYEEVRIDYSSFLNSAIDGGEYSTSHPSRFSLGKEPSTH